VRFATSYFEGGAFPRPPPDGLPVVLGAFTTPPPLPPLLFPPPLPPPPPLLPLPIDTSRLSPLLWMGDDA
jgi:hypothetical protein